MQSQSTFWKTIFSFEYKQLDLKVLYIYNEIESNTGEGGPAILAKVTPRSMGGKGNPEMNPQTQPTFFSVMVVELRAWCISGQFPTTDQQS